MEKAPLKRVSNHQISGCGLGEGLITKEPGEHFHGDRTVLYLDCGNGNTTVHV